MNLSELFEYINIRLIQNPKYLENAVSELNNISITDYDKYINFDSKKYKKNLIKRNDNMEIILICWEKNQETLFHKHPKNGCLMKIIKGSLEETIKKSDKIINNIYTINNCSYIHDNIGIHKVKNIGDDKSISLHIYSPPKFYE